MQPVQGRPPRRRDLLVMSNARSRRAAILTNDIVTGPPHPAGCREILLVLDRTALWIYLGIFGSLVAAGVGFPIPEELPIVAAGALAGHQASEPDCLLLPPEAVAPLAADPRLAVPAAVPWLALLQSVDDRVAAPACAERLKLLAAAPQQPFPAAIPWAGLVAASRAPVPRHAAVVVRIPKPLRTWILLPICILGVVISDGLLYGVGRIWGLKVLTFPFISRMLPRSRLDEIQNNFNRYGVLILLFARMLPGIRSPIFLTAGIMRLPLRKFLLADGIYAIPGVSMLFFLAYWFTDQFKDLVLRAERARPIIALTVIAAIVGFFIWHLYRKPVSVGSPEEFPLVGEQVAQTIETLERASGQHARVKLPPHPAQNPQSEAESKPG